MMGSTNLNLCAENYRPHWRRVRPTPIIIGTLCALALVGTVRGQNATSAPFDPDIAAAAPPNTTPAATGSTASAPASAPSHGRDFLSIDPARTAGSELLLFQDMPVVVSAARQAQPLNLSSIPVSIITADDIHYSARTTLPEIIQFVPGMDVQKVNRGKYAVGVGGLHQTYADRTVTLINGRNAGSPLLGGTDFFALPVLSEDIERIEVVRGPGGAAWGPNALNGVINIITKKPEDEQGFMASSTVDQYGDTYNYLRWGDKRGDLSWRLSLGYENLRSSSSILGDDSKVRIEVPGGAPFSTLTTFRSDDAAVDMRLDAEVAYQFSPETRLSLGLANANFQRGTQEFAGFQPEGHTYVNTLRTFAKLDCTPNEDVAGYVQWFTNYSLSDNASETDLEVQWSVSALKDHKITVGGNLRALSVGFDSERASSLLDTSAQEYEAGLFVMDRWQITKRLALEGQLRGDWYSGTNVDWSGRLTALYGLDDENRQVIRVGAARAFRQPMVGVRNLHSEGIPLEIPGIDGPNFLANPNLGNEHITSVELGYTNQLTDHLTLRLDGYYHRYTGLIGGVLLPDPLQIGRQIVQLQNAAGANAPGAEAEFTYVDKSLRFSVWYSYNGFAADELGQNTRSLYPIQHQAGINTRWNIGDGWTFNSNFKVNGTTGGATNQWDLSVAKAIFDKHGEIIVGVSDVCDATRGNIREYGQLTNHETPGRLFFLRVDMNW
jgi:outer membrane receptor for ferrienterochelin and colicin